MNTEKIVERLKKILALADPARNPSQAEVEAAMAKAMDLAREHGLDLSEIQESAANSEEFSPTMDTIEEDNRRRPDHNYVFEAIIQCLRVRIIYRSMGSDLCRYSVVGYPADVALAKVLIPWLRDTYQRLYKRYLSGGWDTLVKRKSFYRGLTTGIIERNRRAEEQTEASNARYALMVRDKKQRVSDHYDKLFPHATKTRGGQREYDEHAGSRGREEGRKIVLGNQLGGGRPTALIG